MAAPHVPGRGRAQAQLPSLDGWRDNQEGTAWTFRLFRQPTGGIVFRSAWLLAVVQHSRIDRESDLDATFERNGAAVGVCRGVAVMFAQDRLHGVW